jgi:predicted metal-binding membrane protein
MGGLTTAEPRRDLVRLTPQAAVLALASAFAWLGVIQLVRTTGMMPSSDLGQLPTFAATWTLMMAAMMLPGVAPVASLYTRTVGSNRWRRLTLFAIGYLIIWALTSLPAFVVLRAGASLARLNPYAPQVASAAVFVLAGAYQWSPLKRICLDHCRSPLGLLLHYGSLTGRLRDLRVGLHHAAYCVGCCWMLMLLLIALGAMNLVAMLAVAALVILEKYWSGGVMLSRAAGLAAVVLAVLVIRFPQLAGFSPM